jgi:hypothetical protein
MKFKPTAVAIALLYGAAAASAMVVQNIGPATVTYDEITTLASLEGWSNSGSTYKFAWIIPDSAAVVSFGALATNLVNLPSFTLAPNIGWALSGVVTTSLGNLSFTAVGGASTSIAAAASISVNGGPAMMAGGMVAATPTLVTAGSVQGYFGDSMPLPIGAFSSLAVSSASLTLSASGGTFSSITSNPQNKLEIGFTAMPVPEPETYVMLLSGIAVIGWVAKRRRVI